MPFMEGDMMKKEAAGVSPTLAATRGNTPTPNNSGGKPSFSFDGADTKTVRRDKQAFVRRNLRHNGAVVCTVALSLLAVLPLLRCLSPRSWTRINYRPSVIDTTTAGNLPSAAEMARTSSRTSSLFFTSKELEREVVADGGPRCWTDAGGEARCLPTVFFFGVSKCGTTSLSNWMAEHPRARFVEPTPGHDFREGHVFDFSPKLWHDTNDTYRRDRLAPRAEATDTVIDFTPHYAVVAEAPLRIADFYGDEFLGKKGLRFLVVLREPVSRTISSWEYKSELAIARQELTNTINGNGNDNSTIAAGGDNNSTSGASDREERRLRGIEERSLPEVLSEGMERVARLSECVANATQRGLFGNEPQVTYCRATKGKKQCMGKPPCEICNTHTEPWCNPREFLEEVMFNAHVGKSVYAMQLRRWFEVFGQENFKVVFTEDMAEDPLGTLEGVLDFIGLDMVDRLGEKALRAREDWAAIVGSRYNTADKVKKQKLDSQVTPELRQSMREYFAPHNKALQDLLGVPLPSSWDVEGRSATTHLRRP